MPSAFLADRRLIRISGKDAVDFLQNLITCEVEALSPGEFIPGALLTPQGKILFDFIIRREESGESFILETDQEQQGPLVRRLTMYRLRAAVSIEASDDEGVSAFWGEDIPQGGHADSRFGRAGVPLYRLAGKHTDGPEQDYDRLRIDCGIVIAGRDYPLQDAFPHDVMMDVTGGVSFKKGCFVGQEVVSRMKHRGTARRRVAIVSAAGEIVPGQDITAEGKPIGTLGSVVGNRGLAIVRTDRAGDAMAGAIPLLAGEAVVTLELPVWSGLEFPVGAGAAD